MSLFTEPLQKEIASHASKSNIFQSPDIIFDKLKVPLKIQSSSSSKRNDFQIEVDEFTRSPERLYKSHNYSALNIVDPKNLTDLGHSSEAIKSNLKQGFEDILAENLIDNFQSNFLKKLEDDFLDSTEEFSYNDSSLVRPNHLITNFLINPLSGNFAECISDVTTYENKTFSNESKHHEAGGKPASLTLAKAKQKVNITQLEGNSKVTTNDNIENEKKKWSEICLQACEGEDLAVLDRQSLNEVIDSSCNMLDLVNLTNLVTEKSENTEENVSLQYTHFWLSFASHFEPTEATENKDKKEEEAQNDDFDTEELNLGEINEQLEKLPEATEEINQSPMQKIFEKGLEETSGLKKTVSSTKDGTQDMGKFKWAIQDNTDLSNFYELLPRNKFAIEYPFELDDFQKRAVLHLENKESVFVAAHTSAGKTVVAEYAIALAKKHMTRAIYTSPIKALSNQKYRDFMTKFDSVGILTGDVTLKPEASCLIVTTEVLRSMLYKGSDIIKDIEWVIFDEVHYVNNAERGVVWEETIIMLPQHIGIIMLSATVPNAMEFANWVGMTKRRKIFVQTTYKRPTPLEHSIYFNGKFEIIKPKEGNFLAKNYEALLKKMDQDLKDKDEYREKRKIELVEKFDEKGWKFKDDVKKQYFQKKQLDKAQKNKGVMATRTETFKEQKAREEKTRYYQLINHCQKEKLLPCVVFAFSKKKCMELAFGLTGLDLCDSSEKRKITVFYNNALKRLKPVDRELPQLVHLKEILIRGLAVHHGDLLPIAKEIVEILFADGLIKVLFATETFAMGVNMPAKTVVFCGLRKNDGKDFRNLKSSEYTQMSGRAGRRGLDDKGNVVIFIRELRDFPNSLDMKAIIDHKGELLESKFRLTYGIIFNLLLSKEINVLDVMKRSFVEHGKASLLPEQIKKLTEKKDQLKSIEKEFKCKVKPFAEVMPIEDYVNVIETLKTYAGELWTHPQILQKLILPKFARILRENGEMDIGILLVAEKGQDGLVFKTLMHSQRPRSGQTKKVIGYEEESKQAIGEVVNDTTVRVFDVKPNEVIDVFNEKLDFGKIELELKGKQKLDLLTCFNEDKARFSKMKQDKDFFAFAIGSFDKKDTTITQLYNKIKTVKDNIQQHICHNCDMKDEHLDTFNKIITLKDEIQGLSKNISDDNIAYLDQFEARIKILQKLNYLDEQTNPLIKARIARELGNADIFLCEVIMENMLNDLQPEEVAALLSGFVCQVKRVEIDFNHLLPETLLDAMDTVYNISQNVIELEKQHHITFEDEETYLEQTVNMSLAKVVYEWACQKDFAEICQLTDAQEGSIVRTILRLDLLLRDFKSACKIMGNMKLHKLAEDASHLIRRDIVFAGSLYLE